VEKERQAPKFRIWRRASPRFPERRVVSGVDTLTGEGPVEDFTLELTDIREDL